MAFANRPKKKTAKKKTAKKKTTKKKKDESKKPDAKKPEAKTSAAVGGFPKTVTEARIQAVSYDVNTGSNIKFKDIMLTSAQHEKLVAIAQDKTARIRLTIEEVNPPFSGAAVNETSQPEPMFTDLSDQKFKKKTDKKSKKKTNNRTDAKKGKDATDDGSELPI